jgi:hypothetical protein
MRHRTIDHDVASARGRLAANKRCHPESDHSEIEEDLAAAKIGAYIRKVLAVTPLTTERRAHIVALLSDGGTQ